jgi:outer membrane protein assembly factor BamB
MKILKTLVVSSFILGGSGAAQAADFASLFDNTLVWYVAMPDGGERKGATFLFNEDGTVTASQGEISQVGKWEVRGELTCVMVVEPDGAPEDLCSPTANLDGAKVGSEWEFVLREKISVRAVVIAGR